MNRVRRDTFKGRELMSLLRQHVPEDFDPKDFLIAGSARLWADGLTLELSDLDILARPGSATWQRAVEIAFEHAPVFKTAPLRVSDYSGDKIAQLYGGDIEVCETWVMPDSDTEDLLANADVIDGLKYLPIEEVIAYKQQLDREKDRTDLSRIGHHLEYGGTQPVTPRNGMLLSGNVFDGGRHAYPTPEAAETALVEVHKSSSSVPSCGLDWRDMVVAAME